MSAIRDPLFALLDRAGIAHTTHDHDAVFTVEQSASIKAHLPGGHTKNLFLKDKSGQLFLLCALGDTVVPVNKLHKVLGCKRLSFGKAEIMEEVLGVQPGSVTLFALINDIDNRVQLILDQALLAHDIVNFHPLENTATTAIKRTDMEVFAKATGHHPLVLDFTTIQT